MDEKQFLIEPIARVHSQFPTKFGIPRQSGLVESLEAMVVFEPEYRNPDALRGLEEFSHIWLIWQFSQARRDSWSPTVRPPRLGGNARMGVFATRAPFRPNALALSVVKLEGIEKHPEYGIVLRISGADMLHGSPVFDIKPYIPYVDSRPEAKGGFAQTGCRPSLTVEYLPGLEAQVPEGLRAALRGVLAHDPRPSYHDDPERLYGMDFGGLNLKFTVADGVVTVREVQPL